MDRRRFLQTIGAASATALTASTATADRGDSDQDPFGILVDTTRCVGCRNCEEVCAEAHGLPIPDVDDESVFDQTKRTPSETQWSVMTRHESDGEEIYAKRQCMHCLQPACVSACLTKAMYKTPEGPVIWREDKCMGCRFCMVSCPFDVPRFEYNSANPRIQKCTMCWERLKEGERPACVEGCPAEALTFGRRSELLRDARQRICEEPDGYVDHVYGEHEAGGTGYMYLAAAPFEEIGFDTRVGTDSYPALTADFLYGVPIVLALWPAMLYGIRNAVGSKDENNGDT